MPRLANDKYCTGCMACMDACHTGAVKTVEKYGLRYIEVDPTICVECHLCEKACPIISPQKKNYVEDMYVYGGWAADRNIRHMGASGGTFAGIAKSFLQLHKGKACVYGAALIDNNVNHQRITTTDEIPILMNSKYVQSCTKGIFLKVKEDLERKFWVLFSGTPCQIAALYAFLNKLRDSERLLTVEVVCHGVAAKEALDIHLQHFSSSKIYSFRNKEEGQIWYKSQCTTIERDGRPYRFQRKDDVFYMIYSGWLLNRKSCSNCIYSSLDRVADITLADFWGGVRDKSEYDEGVNLIICNNQKANKIIRDSEDIETYDSNLLNAIRGNVNLYSGYKYIQFHPIVLWPMACRKLLPKSIWIQIVKNRMPWKLLWAPYKLATIIRNKRLYKRLCKEYRLI